MTTPISGKEDAFSDPRVDALWRAGSLEEPSAELDAAIRAAARREVSAGPQSTDARESLASRRRWWPLAAAATVAAIAVGVLQLSTPDQLGAPAADNAVVTDMPATDGKRAPDAPKVVPLAPDAPKVVPLVPDAPKVVPLVPDAPKVVPLVPDAPKVAPLMPDASKVVPRDKSAPEGATTDQDRLREEPAKIRATDNRTPPQADAAKDKASDARMGSRQESGKDVAAAPPPARTEAAARKAMSLPEPFPVSPASQTQRAPPIAATALPPGETEAAVRKAMSLPEPFPASPAPDRAPGAAANAAAALGLAESVAPPAPFSGTPQGKAGAKSALDRATTMQGDGGGAAKVGAEPKQPGAPAAALQAAPQGAQARSSSSGMLSKESATEGRADATRMSEMAKERDASTPTQRARSNERGPLPVAEWVALIRRLRDEGKTDDAARELAAFRAAHADHDRLLPRDLIDWRPPAK